MSMSAADWVSAVRIALVLPITAALWLQHNGAALALYALAPVSDLLDGRLARLSPGKKSGFDFDGMADVVFGVSIVAWGFWKLPQQRLWFAVYLPILVLWIFVFLAVSIRLTGKVVLLHLWSGKLMGWTAYLWFGASHFFGAGPWTAHVAAACAIWFYIEGVVYIARGGRNPDGRSAFF